MWTIMCSTMRSIFNLCSTFNALFYIQLHIQHSTVHFIFNSLFTHSIIYSTISTIYSTFNFNFWNIQLFIQHSTLIQHSTIHSTLLRPHYFWSVTHHCLLKTWRRRQHAAARMPTTEIEAYEDGTRLHYDVESDFPRFLDSVLQRTDQISQQHIVVVGKTVRCVCFVYPGIPRDSSSNINAYDKETLDNLSSAFSDVWLLHKFSNICKSEEGWYGQLKYCYKKQYTLFSISIAVFFGLLVLGSMSYQPCSNA